MFLTYKQITIIILTIFLTSVSFILNKFIYNPSVKNDNIYTKEFNAILISTLFTAILREIIIDMI